MIPTASDETLPPFLRECPTEMEEMPLQMQLLTMEVAALRLALTRLARLLLTTAQAIEPPDPLAGLGGNDGG